MEVETTISKNIRITDDKAKYDAACKRLLSEKSILAWIMKSCVQEFQDVSVKEIAEKYIEGTPVVGEMPVAPDTSSMITGSATEDSMIHEGTILYDIRFWATAPFSLQPIRLILNVEAQNDFYPGYPLITRGIYYCSRMISAQHGVEFTDSHYEKIKKVYSIWICLNPPKKRRNTITKYEIEEKHLIGNVKEPKKNYDLLTAVMVCLGSPEDESEDLVLKLLNVLLSDEVEQAKKRTVLEEDFGIPMTESLGRTVSLMCNLSQSVENRGIEKGIKQGTEKTLLESIQNLVEALKITTTQAMDILKVPEQNREKYLKMLNK